MARFLFLEDEFLADNENPAGSAEGSEGGEQTVADQLKKGNNRTNGKPRGLAPQPQRVEGIIDYETASAMVRLSRQAHYGGC